MRTKAVKTKSKEQALSALMRECAKSERSTGDALRLMTRWGVDRGEQEKILKELVEHRFIDNRRFAEAYVRDKINLSRWGERRIRQELYGKGVEREIIDCALESLDDKSMRCRLTQLLEKRSRTIKHKDVYDLKGKLLRYAASLGYDFEMINSVIADVIKKDNREWQEDCF